MFEALRWRLTAWYVAVFCTVFVVVGLVVFLWANRRYSNEIDGAVRTVGTRAATAAGQHEQILESDPDVRAVLASASLSGTADVFVLLLNPDGSLASDPSNIPLGSLPDADSAEAARASGSDARTHSVSGQDLRLDTIAVHDASGRLTGFVQAGKSVEDREASLRTLVIVMAGGGVTGLLLATAGGLLVAGMAIRPVKRSFERQREFVADASHELRTPLAVIRVNAEAAANTARDSEAVEDIAAEATYMTRLLDDLLLLARSDREGIDLQVERVDLAEIARSAGRAAGRLAEGRGRQFASAIDDSLQVLGDAARCREVILILLDNAVKYTGEGGRIHLAASAVDNQAVVTITDTGIGVKPEEIERLFDRFYRVDKARSRAIGGAGLGLSIAREIMNALGGSLSIESQPGQGTTVSMRMPLAPALHADAAVGRAAPA